MLAFSVTDWLLIKRLEAKFEIAIFKKIKITTITKNLVHLSCLFFLIIKSENRKLCYKPEISQNGPTILYARPSTVECY